MELEFDDSAYALLLQRCAQWESGARMIDAILNAEVLPGISRELLEISMHALGEGNAESENTAWMPQPETVIRVQEEDGHFVLVFRSVAAAEKALETMEMEEQ